MDVDILKIIELFPVVGIMAYLLVRQEKQIEGLIETICRIKGCNERQEISDIPQNLSDNYINHPPTPLI